MKQLLTAYTVMCLIFGTTFLAIKIGNDAGIPPFFAAGIRFTLAGSLLFIFCLKKKTTSLSLLWRKEVFIIGSCLSFMTFAGLYYGEKYISSGVAAVLSATGPLMIIWIQSMITKKKPHVLSMLGCLIAMTGVVMILVPELSFDTKGMWLVGAAAVLLGEIFYAAGSVYSGRTASRLRDHASFAVNGAQMLYGGLMLLLLSAITEQPRVDVLFHLPAAGSVLYLTVFGSMIGHSLFYYLVTRTNPLFPSTWLYISPMIALGIGMFFYEEHVSWLTLFGSIIIIGGLILANWNTLKGLLQKKEPASIAGTSQISTETVT